MFPYFQNKFYDISKVKAEIELQFSPLVKNDISKAWILFQFVDFTL